MRYRSYSEFEDAGPYDEPHYYEDPVEILDEEYLD